MRIQTHTRIIVYGPALPFTALPRERAFLARPDARRYVYVRKPTARPVLDGTTRDRGVDLMPFLSLAILVAIVLGAWMVHR